jgi:uncharacterized protein YdeI (YjbR/CyaY-like superfamily)
MGSKALKTFDARTHAQWRQWLARHHDSESEVWLIFHKRHTGRPSVAYEDALDEALCFGWIDSLIKRLDEARYARKFTPRKLDSKWSPANRKRYAQLKASGRLMPAGLERPPADHTYAPPRPFPSKLPQYIQEALEKHPTALKHFEKLAPSHRRRHIGWIHFAKKQETKMRRLQEAVRVLAAGKPLGLK